MAGIISFDGLATGIKSSDTVDKIMAVEARPKLLKEAEKTRLENESTAWQNINSKLLELREKAKSLWAASAWNTLAAKSSDEAVLTASSSSSARPGRYTFVVSKLAQNQQLASNGYASSSATVGSGTLTIGIGTNTKAVTIDGSNNTLAGVAQAINDAGAGVTASVINDGTEGTGYKLLLSSDKSGAANTVTVSAGAGLSLSFPTVVQDAQDAEVKFGSGAGAITVKSATNTVTGLVDGVTLNLLAEKAGTPVTLTVSRDTAGAQESIQAFVDSYNGAMGLISSQFLYNDQSKAGGILMGDQTLVAIQSRIQSMLVSPVATGGTFTSLQAVGLELADDGTLSFDSSKFSTAATKDYASLEKLFRTNGQADTAKIGFVFAGKNASEPTKSGYSVAISRAATQTSLLGGADVSSLTVDASNDTLTLAFDGGAEFSVVLTQKTYASLSELAAELQTRISAAAPTGSSASVAVEGNKLRLTSQRYGSLSAVSVTGGDGRDGLGFATSVLSQGLDVAGTINGEAATGSGKVLTGSSGNAKTAGIQLQIEFTEADVLAGDAHGILHFSKGVAARFNEYLQDLTDPILGSIETKQSGIQRSIADLETQMDDLQKRMDDKRERLMEMFRKMEESVNRLNGQGTYLMNALAGLNK